MADRSVKTLLNLFRYKSDDGYDDWEFMEEEAGVLEGDCEDFALTAALWLADNSLLQFWIDIFLFRSVIWFCKTSDGTGHAMLWRRGKGWIDNIHPQWRDRPIHTRWFPYWGPLLAFKLLVA